MLSIKCICLVVVLRSRELTNIVASRLHSIGVRGPRRLCVVHKKQLDMGNYWLLKTEPDCWSWDNQTANKGLSVWDGVRNHQAQKAMRNMVEGDLCFFYHTGKLKEVSGIVRVVKTYYPDPTDDTGKWGAVDVEEVLPLKSPVTLGQMKEDEEIVDFLMFRQPRLSVVPVEENVWKRICSMGEVEPPLLDSSGDIMEKVQATNGTKKRAAEKKTAPAEKQDRKRGARGGKKIIDDEESEEPSKVTKKQSSQQKERAAKGGKKIVDDEESGEPPKLTKSQSSQQKEKRTPGAKGDKSKATNTKTSVTRSRTGVNGNDVRKNAQAAKVEKKRVTQSKPAVVEEEEEEPSAKANKKRASRAKSVPVEKRAETEPRKPSNRPSKKPKK